MAQVAGTQDTYRAIGEREELMDIIYNISPQETPFMSNIGKQDVSSTLVEWQTRSLAATAANRQIEGDDVAFTTFAPTTRVGNYCQISSKDVIVSGTLETVSKAGRKSELAYHLADRMKELKRDIERALTQNQASSAGGSGTARSLASLESWLASNKTSLGTGTAQTTPGFSSGTVAAPTDSTVAGTLTEAALKVVIREVWSAGGQATVIMCGPVNKQRISGFVGNANQWRAVWDTGPGKVPIIGAADVYYSDYGELRVIPNRFQRDQTLFVLDFDYWSVGYLRPIQQKEIARTGDAEKRLLITEFTLVAKNEAASGKITDLATTGAV